MKFNSFFILFLCYTAMSSAQAQKGDIEISGSVGTLSAIYMISSINDGIAGDPPIQPNGPKPDFFISGRYYMGKRIALGLTAGMETISGGTTQYGLIQGNAPYTYQVHYYTVAAEFTFIYKKTKYFQIYTTCGLGGSLYRASGSYPQGASFPASDNNNPTSGTFMNAYLSPFGFRAGKDIAVFMECGIGYKGLINGGISVRFKTRMADYR